MTPAELTTARTALGLNAADLGRRLEMEGRDPGRMIRLWETGVHPVPGPAAVAIRYMIQEQARQGLQAAVERAQAVLETTDQGIVFSDPQGSDMRPLHQRVVGSRRRG